MLHPQAVQLPEPVVVQAVLTYLKLQKQMTKKAISSLKTIYHSCNCEQG